MELSTIISKCVTAEPVGTVPRWDREGEKMHSCSTACRCYKGSQLLRGKCESIELRGGAVEAWNQISKMVHVPFFIIYSWWVYSECLASVQASLWQPQSEGCEPPTLPGRYSWMPHCSGQKASWKTILIWNTTFKNKTKTRKVCATWPADEVCKVQALRPPALPSGAGIVLQQRTFFSFIYCAKRDVQLMP